MKHLDVTTLNRMIVDAVREVVKKNGKVKHITSLPYLNHRRRVIGWRTEISNHRESHL